MQMIGIRRIARVIRTQIAISTGEMIALRLPERELASERPSGAPRVSLPDWGSLPFQASARWWPPVGW
jgi:hypothetical protein